MATVEVGPVPISTEEEEAFRRGWTLPGSWYTDPAILDAERELIFARSWQYAGLTSQIPDAGDFFTCRAGHIPVVVVRDTEGDIRAFVNVCRHRGSLVVTEPCGHRMTLQCPYHAWTYGLDGTLRRAPREERNEVFDGAGIALRSMRVAEFGPVLFVNPDPDAAPFEELYAPWMELIRSTGVDMEDVLFSHDYLRLEIDANWKIVIENSLECYHCPTNHPSLHAVIDVNEDQWVRGHEYAWVYGSKPAPEFLERTGRTYDGEPWRKVSCVWPNLLFSMLPGGAAATATRVLPLAVDRTLYLRQYCFSDRVPQKEREETMAWWEDVIREDVDLCVMVQEGLASGCFDQGPLLLPRTEPGIRFHQRLVYRALTGREAPA